MRVERQNLTARVLNESSQIVGGFSRPSSAVQPANHVEEVIRPTEDQQYELGVEVLAVIAVLAVVAVFLQYDKRRMHHLTRSWKELAIVRQLVHNRVRRLRTA